MPDEPGSRLRGALALLPAVTYGFVAAGVLCVLALVAPAFARRRLHRLARAWGRPILWLYGVRIELRGREHLEGPGPKLVLYNHQSTLDLFLLAALMPPGALVLYTSELHRIPLIGWSLFALGMAPVHLEQPRRAVRDTLAAGRRARETDATLLIAPEGGRSSAGELQPFRPGAFRVAQGEGLPIVLLVFRDPHDLLPRDSILVRPGTVVVDALRPIDTTRWDPSRLREHIEAVRDVFVQHLVPRRASPPGA